MDKMVQNATPNDEYDETDEEDLNSEEYLALSDKIDELNDALDSFEKKNDDIQAQLIDLLQSNRKIRQEIQEKKLAEEQAQQAANSEQK